MAGDVSERCSGTMPRRPAIPTRDRSEAILDVSLRVADRGEQARSQFRGAIVEALTERLLAARTGPIRRERRILFDGRPAEIHPYDVTVEAEAAGEAWDCKWGARGIKADVIHQLDDARRGAAEDGARLVVGLVVFDARRSCEVRMVRERGAVALEGMKLIALESLDRLAGRQAGVSEAVDPGAANRTATVAYRVRFDECGPDGLARTSAMLRYAQDVAWIHSERLGFDRDWYAARGLTWLVRAAQVAILRPVPLGTTLDVSTTVAGFRKVWARRRTDGRLADGTARLLGAHRLGDRRRARPPDPGAGRVPGGVRRPCPARSSPGGCRCRRRRRMPRSIRASSGPQDVDPLGHVNNAAYLDYLEEALLAAGDAGAAAIAATPRSVWLEYLGQATPGAVVAGSAWRAAGARRRSPTWAWRLTDAAGVDLARGRYATGADAIETTPGRGA